MSKTKKVRVAELQLYNESKLVLFSDEKIVHKNKKYNSTKHDHSLALDSEGNIYTWGRNSSGQLGDGTTTNKDIPTKIYFNLS